jgi:hypothetical protein
LTGAEAEGSTIPEAVPVEGLAPETQVAAAAAPELVEVASKEAPAMAGEERDDVPPESTLEVVVRSPEIQDAELIYSAPMSGAATSSRGGVELLANNHVDPVAVARHLEAMLSYGPPWVHYLGGYQDRLLGGPLGLPGLRCTAPDGVKHKDYRGEVLG